MDVDQNPGRSTWSTWSTSLVSHDEIWGSGVKSSPWNTGRPSFAVAAGWIRLAASGGSKNSQAMPLTHLGKWMEIV